jgi:2-keto-4-pentenoate hydratase/2-oxohepta-3-ene-1,7-dioic acid hydratase in catechol pathway
MPTYLRYQQAGSTRYGELSGETIHPLDGEIGNFRPSAQPSVRLADVRLLAPAAPSKIIAIGPNYRAGLPEGMPLPERPMFWTKPASCLNHPEGIIEIQVGDVPTNHEVELAIVIGKTASRVKRAQAAQYILGYTCMNDVTVGNFAQAGAFMNSPYFVYGKIFDGFAPLGPWVVTDLDTRDLHLECRINGEVRQSHSTADRLFEPDALLEMVSHIVTLLPGDVISTGSPPGVQPMKHGDVVEIEIQNIGTLRNHARNRT